MNELRWNNYTIYFIGLVKSNFLLNLLQEHFKSARRKKTSKKFYKGNHFRIIPDGTSHSQVNEMKEHL